MFPAPNQILAGKYRFVRQLGQGGMGSVWLAEHLTLRSPVALKLIEPSIASNADALARFMREAQAAASLRSPHVVQILDYGVDAGVPFIVMEALEGESLAGRLVRLRRLSPAETSKLITHIGRAMTRAHDAGIVHRDLKPDNVFIVRNDEEELAKVLDFGVAKSNPHGVSEIAFSATRTGAVLGTPYYMSPEQAEGTRQMDHRTDIWAMGVIACECLLGVRPFEAETLGALLLSICARELPVPSRLGPVVPGFDQWFARACARDLAYRFSTAKEAAADLRRICQPGLAPAYAVQGPDPGERAFPAGAPTPRSSQHSAGTTASLSVEALPRVGASSAANAARFPVLWAVLAGAFLVAVAAGAWAIRGSGVYSASSSSATQTAPHASELPREPATLSAPASAAVPAPVMASPTPAATVPVATVAAPSAEHAAVARMQPAHTASSGQSKPTREPVRRVPTVTSDKRPPASQLSPAAPATQAPVNLGI